MLYNLAIRSMLLNTHLMGLQVEAVLDKSGRRPDKNAGVAESSRSKNYAADSHAAYLEVSLSLLQPSHPLHELVQRITKCGEPIRPYLQRSRDARCGLQLVFGNSLSSEASSRPSAAEVS